MAEHTVRFDDQGKPAVVATGSLLVEAARLAGLEISQPCGGQGRCGRCAVRVVEGDVRRRSTLRLSSADIAAGYALACQSVVEGDVRIHIPPQEKIERRLTTDRTTLEVSAPPGYDPATGPSVRRLSLSLPEPSLEDQTDDWGRLQAALRRQGVEGPHTISLHQLRRLGTVLREGQWQITAVLNQNRVTDATEVIDLHPGHTPADAPLWAVAIDIGTTTVTLWLVDLTTGVPRAQVAEYNQQIRRGEDVISRIIFASKGEGGQEMQSLILETINGLVERACKQAGVSPETIMKGTVTGNSTMMHLFLNIPPESIRLAPFITAVNQPPELSAYEVGLQLHPSAVIDCLPGVASYVGADISAGVLSSGQDESPQTTLFMDVGTNGEIVLGSSDWLATCACSAGPAFEGAGVRDGMRATRGAIEEVWIHGETLEPTYRVIGNVKPRGLCGSGLISLMAEMFLTGVVDKGGNIDTSRESPRIRQGSHGSEYVVAWAETTGHGEDVVITRTDLDNLMRAKAAIYAGFSMLAQRVGVSLESVDRVLIGGSFGKYINVEKAIEIGLLPDIAWDRIEFLGNTAIQGAYLGLLDHASRNRIDEIASRMTYIELSADNDFYEAFMSAMFLPHTNLDRFPSVKAAIGNDGRAETEQEKVV